MLAHWFRRLAMHRMNWFARRGRALRQRRRVLGSFFRLEERVTPATVLSLGDIAFTGYQATTADKVSFVLLKDVTSGTVITITDNAWTGSALNTNEGNSILTFG